MLPAVHAGERIGGLLLPRAASSQRPRRSPVSSADSPRRRWLRHSAAAWPDAPAGRNASRASSGRAPGRDVARSSDPSVARSPCTTASTADSNRQTAEPSSVTAATCSARRAQFSKSYARATVSCASGRSKASLRTSASDSLFGSHGIAGFRKRGCLCLTISIADSSPARQASSSAGGLLTILLEWRLEWQWGEFHPSVPPGNAAFIYSCASMVLTASRSSASWP